MAASDTEQLQQFMQHNQLPPEATYG
jgi:hypothetical protein